jgi:hypothetical protein
MRTGALAAAVLAAAALTAAGAAAQGAGSPDGLRAAEYSVSSTRYGHDALGPGHEWAMLALHRADGGTLFYRNDREIVFEDSAPRLVDADGDGDLEALVVESSHSKGSRLAVWTGAGRLAATPFIGRRHRWLAPVGAADLDGDGRVEIAYVETPHLGKVLKVVRLEGDRLVPVAEAAGLTNHRFGDPFIQGRIATCDGRATILTADADWRRVIATTLSGGALSSRDLGPYRGAEGFDRLAGFD